MGVTYTVPDEAITLRYSSAIDVKRRQYAEWLERHHVHREDAFVIAVNSGQLPYALTDVFPPRVCKALFPIGAEYVSIRGGEIVAADFITVRRSRRLPAQNPDDDLHGSNLGSRLRLTIHEKRTRAKELLAQKNT
jgi:hypothetical protein